MKTAENHYLGRFKVNKRSFAGQVTLKGPESKIELFSDSAFHVPHEEMHTIKGIAETGEKLTICDAIGSPACGSRFYHGTKKYFVELFPHYVAIGPRHLDFHKEVVSSLMFTTSGAIDLFYDHGAFGHTHVTNIRKLMPDWAKKSVRKIKANDVFYYVNRGPIASIDTDEFHFQAFNAISYFSPSPKGIQLTNEVRIVLDFKKPRLLSGAIAAAFEFRGFFEILSQTKHCIRNITVKHKAAAETGEGFISLRPSYEEADAGAQTDFRDNFISPSFQKAEFETVLRGWLKGNDKRSTARFRIIEGMRSGIYTTARLVGAANAFDILPDLALIKPVIPPDVDAGLKALKKQAKTLPLTIRNRALDSIGRLTASNLRLKIEARFNALPADVKSLLPEMQMLIDCSVKTRNYFVHGTPPKFSDELIRQFMFFFTDTLEFVFVASELADCGWQGKRWLKEANGGRMREYVRNYGQALLEFKDARNAEAATAGVLNPSDM